MELEIVLMWCRVCEATWTPTYHHPNNGCTNTSYVRLTPYAEATAGIERMKKVKEEVTQAFARF